MNFNKLFVFLALSMAIFLGQSEANFLRNIKERTVSFLRQMADLKSNNQSFPQEGTLLYIKNATLQVIEVGKKAADVAATARGSQKG